MPRSFAISFTSSGLEFPAKSTMEPFFFFSIIVCGISGSPFLFGNGFCGDPDDHIVLFHFCLPGHDRTGTRPYTVRNVHRRHKNSIGTDKNFFSDLRYMFAPAVVIRRDHASPDIRPVTDHRIAEIGEMFCENVFPDPAPINLHKTADHRAIADHRSFAELGERADLAFLADLHAGFDITPRLNHRALPRKEIAFQKDKCRYSLP